VFVLPLQQGSSCSTGGKNHGNATIDQIVSQCAQSIHVIVGGSIFKGHVPTVYVANLSQACPEADVSSCKRSIGAL